MTYELISNRNIADGFHIIFIYLNDVTGGLFIRLFIFSIWLFITFGLFYSQKRESTKERLSSSMAVGGFITSIITILLRLIPNLIDNITFTVVIAISVLSVLYFLFHDRE